VISAGVTVRDTIWAVTPGLNYYVFHDNRLKIQLDYSFLRNTYTNQSPHIDENIVRMQLSAFFLAGHAIMPTTSIVSFRVFLNMVNS